jgi:hypothetical protein
MAGAKLEPTRWPGIYRRRWGVLMAAAGMQARHARCCRSRGGSGEGAR